MQSDNPEHKVQGDAAATDDVIIGRVFRWSLGLILTLGAFAAIILYFLYGRPQPPETIVEKPITGPWVASPASSVEPPRVTFTDITDSAGIDFIHVSGAHGDKLLPETMGGGVAFLDYDNDRDPDLLFVNSNHWPEHAPHGKSPTMALYRNDGSGAFDSVTEETGLAVSFYGMGTAVGDYDNDGFPDVYITALGKNHLFHNDQGVFREVTAEAGVAGSDTDWSTGSTFFDYDNDGDLDLFVVNYVRWSKAIDFEIGFQLTGIGRAYGPPTTFEGSFPYLYRNNGDGTFTDVSQASGIQVKNPATGGPMAKALAVAPVDFDGDNWLDLFVANDTVQNFLFHNRGDGSFEEVGMDVGVAFDRNGNATGAMGVDAAYYRNDGALGVAVGNFANEMTSLYVSQGDTGQFADEAIVDGLGAATRRALTFGLFFFDYDLDGWLDLFHANGHLEEDIHLVQTSQHYAQPPQLFWNCGQRCATGFVEVERSTHTGLDQRLVARGASFGDIDSDGDLDIVITQAGRRPVLLRNDQQLGHHWVRIKLTGHRVNRDAIGSWVEVDSGGHTQRRQVMRTRSYLSQVELPLTFGLGNRTQIDGLHVRWPDGSIQHLNNVPVDSLVVIEQRPPSHQAPIEEPKA